jgi:hypothetical protein
MFAEDRVTTLDLRQSTIFSRLRGLLEVTRLVRTGEELPELLSAIARTISDSLGYRTVAINLYRREWDDFVVTTVYGSDEAREALLGQVRQPATGRRCSTSGSCSAGRYLVPAGEFDWSEHGAFTHPAQDRRPRRLARRGRAVRADARSGRQPARDPLGRRADLRPQADR